MSKELLGILNKEDKRESNNKLKINNRLDTKISEIMLGLQKTIEFFEETKYACCIPSICNRFAPIASAEEIHIFCLQDIIKQKYLGPYISSLINKSNDKKIVIQNIHNEPINNLGSNNYNKEITLIRNFGDYVGSNMFGGKITVNGNVGDFFGTGLRGGILIANGNVGKCVGIAMFGGDIYLNCDYNSISESIIGGNIYHKGNQIIKDGKPLEGLKIR